MRWGEAFAVPLDSIMARIVVGPRLISGNAFYDR